MAACPINAPFGLNTATSKPLIMDSADQLALRSPDALLTEHGRELSLLLRRRHRCREWA